MAIKDKNKNGIPDNIESVQNARYQSAIRADAANKKRIADKAAADKAAADKKAADAKKAAAAKAAAAAKKITDAKKATTTTTKAPVENEGVAPLTGKSWQQIADEKDAADKAAADEAARLSGIAKVGTVLRYKPGSKSGTRIAVYADGAGGEFDGGEENDPIEPGSTGFETGDTGVTKVTLARNTFANTMALLVGETEATQPWVNELYDLMQGFLNTGSTIEEAQNLALRDAKNSGKASKFVQRFGAIFKLQDRLNAGETVQVPSIADYVKSEQALGDVFRSVGLGDLATQEMAAKILGDANKSVSEATDIISNVFMAIDNAPGALGADLKTYLNKGLDRTSIAKALLTGKEGALELTKKVKSIEQLSAAKSQGVGISLAEGADLAAMGADYGTSLGKFGEVKRLERGQTLGRMSNIDFTQQEAIASQFAGNAAADEKIRRIKEQEMNRFSGASGRLASQSRAQGLI